MGKGKTRGCDVMMVYHVYDVYLIYSHMYVIELCMCACVFYFYIHLYVYMLYLYGHCRYIASFFNF